MAKKNEKKVQDWNSIAGVMRAYGQELSAGKKSFIKYSASIGVKNDDGEYDNFYFDLKFAKSCKDAPEDAGEVWIDIKDAFLSCKSFINKDGDKIVKPVIVVTDCTVLD